MTIHDSTRPILQSLRAGLVLLVANACAANAPPPSQGHETGPSGERAPEHISPQASRDSGAESVVREYLRRDAAGERLRPSDWFASISVWEGEPGWDEFTVIGAYHVRAARVDGDSAVVSVRYLCYGRMVQSEGRGMAFVPDSAPESQVFSLVHNGGRWRVASPQINPHVSVEASLQVVPQPDNSRRLLELLPRHLNTPQDN